MSNNVRYYPKVEGSTRHAIKSFQRMLPKMGTIVKAWGEQTRKHWYRVHFQNEEGKQFVFRGFSWGYHGEGSRGLVLCLAMLGIDASYLLEHSICGGSDIVPSWFINFQYLDAQLKWAQNKRYVPHFANDVWKIVDRELGQYAGFGRKGKAYEFDERWKAQEMCNALQNMSALEYKWMS